LLSTRPALDGDPLERLVLDEALARKIASQVAVAVFGGEREMEATILDRSGLANSIVVRDPLGWSELLVRYFPYPLSEGAGEWRQVISEVFEFECEHWSRWDRAIAGLSVGERLQEIVHYRSPWEADRIPCCPILEIEGQRVPSLVRRYLPWPSVRAASLGEERTAALLARFFHETLPLVLPAKMQVSMDQAFGWLRADDPRLSRDHLLTDGHHVVPTRWRSLCKAARRVTLGDFQARR